MIYEIDETLHYYEALVIDDIMTEVISFLDLKESVSVMFTRSEVDSAGCIQFENDEYLVEIPSNESKREIALAVAHEMKHVEQYDKGLLTQGSTWCGRCYRNFPYRLRPWEIEAFAFEKIVNYFDKYKEA